MRTSMAVLILLGASSAVEAGDPPPVSPTRAELKQQLEGSKKSKPRLPLPPPPTAAELAEAKARVKSIPGMGGGIVNNGWMRKYYLPKELTTGGFAREKDPAVTLDYPFKTKLFWIVSRGNNCIYCQGHQEVKLASAGVPEETIAALDGAWDGFTPAERAAFELARKLTLRPDAISSVDIDALRPYYNERAIVEILTAVAGFNSTNRWTGGLAIPQEEHRVFLTPTLEAYRNLRSRVAPLDPNASGAACAAPAQRGGLEPRDQVEAALKACRVRTPRVALAGEAEARSLLASDASSGTPAAWIRLLALFPVEGKARINLHRNAETAGKLDRKLRAEIAWVAARNDRAWYALDIARKRLTALGMTADQMFALEDPNADLPAGTRAVLALSKKLTVDPALVADDDVEAVRRHFSDHEVAEVVFQITEAAFFDRLTEAAGLPLDD